MHLGLPSHGPRRRGLTARMDVCWGGGPKVPKLHQESRLSARLLEAFFRFFAYGTGLDERAVAKGERDRERETETR